MGKAGPDQFYTLDKRPDKRMIGLDREGRNEIMAEQAHPGTDAYSMAELMAIIIARVMAGPEENGAEAAPEWSYPWPRGAWPRSPWRPICG
ncbi:MAG: hypothetical protein QGF09_05950 [Rhodospirillales bacterium]|nr:hypothetical protein [Rhodospirillales bacterium]